MQLGGAAEAVAIFVSDHPNSELFAGSTGSKQIVQLLFNEDSKVDPAVMDILQEEVDCCLAVAGNFRENGDLAKALNKYEEAYVISF